MKSEITMLTMPSSCHWETNNKGTVYLHHPLIKYGVRALSAEMEA
jgi:hypothetical protein